VCQRRAVRSRSQRSSPSIEYVAVSGNAARYAASWRISFSGPAILVVAIAASIDIVSPEVA
jgi:hypothetical protein